MGEAFGEACRDATRELYEHRLQTAVEYARVFGHRAFDADQVLALGRRCLAITEAYDSIGYEEFLGIAHGADLTPEQLFVMQGLTDVRDVLSYSPEARPDAAAAIDTADAEGCSAFMVAPSRARDGRMLVGQTWDLISNNMPYVRLVSRRPTDAPETISLTLTGCLTLIGLNSEGLAVGTTNLRTTDARPGVQYLSILHRMMRCRDVAEAEPCVTDAPRAAAHYYFIADATGRGVGLECSALQTSRFTFDEPHCVHCNHALTEPVSACEAPATAADSSPCRQQRLAELLQNHDGPIGVEDVKRMLGDREGGDMAISRYRSGRFDISTNAVVIISPQTGAFHACRGQADRGQWHTVRLAQSSGVASS